jgi:uncharacterized protein
MRYLIVLLLVSLHALAEPIPPRPSPPQLVNDLAGVFSAEEVNVLERYLVDYNDSTSTQVVVLTVRSTDGEDPNMYAAEVGEKWGVGQRGQDNGVVILLAIDDRKVAIQTGYGLEEFINAALAKSIIEDRMIPYFREGKYFDGTAAGITAVTRALSGQFTGTGPADPKLPVVLVLGFIVIAIVVMVIVAKRGGGGGGWHADRGGFHPWIFPTGGGHRGGGFGGFGGGGGGGFGGFGGGSFGGGGASGGW